MMVSDEVWGKQQQNSLKYALQYKWKDDWKVLYKNHLKDFFGIDGQFTGLTVVDVGCGPRGIISVIEAERKVGIEPLMNKYKEVFDDLESDVEYINAKAEEIPLPNDFADVVFCTNTLNHVQDPEQVLTEINRILKPTGTLYFNVHDNPISIGHPHSFTKDQIFTMLGKYFKIIKANEQNEMPTITFTITGSGKERIVKKRAFIANRTVKGAICLSQKYLK